MLVFYNLEIGKNKKKKKFNMAWNIHIFCTYRFFIWIINKLKIYILYENIQKGLKEFLVSILFMIFIFFFSYLKINLIWNRWKKNFVSTKNWKFIFFIFFFQIWPQFVFESLDYFKNYKRKIINIFSITSAFIFQTV